MTLTLSEFFIEATTVEKKFGEGFRRKDIRELEEDLLSCYARVLESHERKVIIGLSETPYSISRQGRRRLGFFRCETEFQSKLHAVLPSAAKHEIHYLNSSGFWGALADIAKQKSVSVSESITLEHARFLGLSWALRRVSDQILLARYDYFSQAIESGTAVAKSFAEAFEASATSVYSDKYREGLSTLQSDFRKFLAPETAKQQAKSNVHKRNAGILRKNKGYLHYIQEVGDDQNSLLRSRVWSVRPMGGATGCLGRYEVHVTPRSPRHADAEGTLSSRNASYPTRQAVTGVWGSGTTEGITSGVPILPEDDGSGFIKNSIVWAVDFDFLYGVAGERRSRGATVCDFFEQAIQILHSPSDLHGGTNRIQHARSEARSDGLIRCESRLPASSVASRHVGRLCFPLQRGLLSMSSDAVWMGTSCVLVYAINVTGDQENKELGIPGISLHRRCVNHTSASSERINSSGLSACFTSNRLLVATAGCHEKSKQRSLGLWGSSCEALGLHCGHEQDDVFRSRVKATKYTRYGSSTCAGGTFRPTLGVGEAAIKFFRADNIPSPGRAAGSVLQPRPLCLFEWKEEIHWRSIACSHHKSSCAGSQMVVSLGCLWPTHAPTPGYNNASLRRLGHWMGRDSLHGGRSPSRFRGGVRVPGYLEPPRGTTDYTVEGTQGALSGIASSFTKLFSSAPIRGTFRQCCALLSRQFRLPIYCAEHVHQNSRVYAAFAPPPSPSRLSPDSIEDEVASFCNERSRRQTIPFMGPTRHSNESEGIKVGERYIRSSPWGSGVLLSEARRSSDSTTESRHRIAESGLGGRPLSTLQSSGRLDIADIIQNGAREHEGHPNPSGLAQSSMVRHGSPPCQDVALPSSPRFNGFDGGSLDPELLEARINRGRERGLTGRVNLTGEVLGQRIRDHIMNTLGAGPQSRGAMRLLRSTATSKTLVRKAAQLASFDTFMAQHGLSYPATGANLACWIGFISECRLRGKGTSIAGTSLSGYISGIRTSLVALGHPRLPTLSENFALRAVYHAYLKWDGSQFPTSSPLRVPIPARTLFSMIPLVMDSDNFVLIQALAMIFMSRCHGLRADSVENIPFSGFELTPDGWTVLVTKLKNHSEVQARKYGARSFRSQTIQGFPVTCRDVMERWLY